MDAQVPCFVVALPRSRTAWMAAWLDIPHELMDGCYSEDDFLDRCTVGTSDAWLSWFPIRKYFKKSPIIVIHRDVKDVISSYENISGIRLDNCIIDILDKSCKRMSAIEDAMHIKFEDIDDSLEKIWNHLKPNEKFDINRANSYKRLNIQVMNLSGDIDTFKAFVGV